MVRVTHQKSMKQTNASNGVRSSKVSKQRKNHKVVIESDSQDKENSRAVLSFRAEPPPGYTFIPAGNPQLTSALKEFAKRGNHQILAVTTTPHASRHELSREVHRIGFHFPTEVVAQVCNHYGIRLTSGGKLVEEKDDDKLFMRLYQKGQLALDEQVRDQVTINTEAKQIIQDLFPRIPDNDLFQIIKTAFQLGDGKVGTADEIPLVRRAQLSVVAHIRHTYTSYDKLLRTVPYSEARHRVESITLQKLIDWRGDDQDDKQAMDDTLREVVVISDEETEDEVEEGQVLEHKYLQVQPISTTARLNTNGDNRPRLVVDVPSDDEEPRGYRYLPQVVRRYPVEHAQAATVARQQSRYAVWDRVRQEYRNGRIPQQPRVVERIPLDEPSASALPTPYVSRDPTYVSEPPSRRILEPTVHVVPQQNLPTYVRGADGKLYERITTHAEPVPASAPPRRIYTPPPADSSRQYIDSRHMSPRVQTTHLHRRTESFEINDGTVLPSIESPHSAHPLSAGRRNPFEEPRPTLDQRHSGVYESSLRQTAIADPMNNSLSINKRRRVEEPPLSPYPVRRTHVEYSHDRDRLPTDSQTQYIEDAHVSQQQRPILLNNPPEPRSYQEIHERPELKRRPTIVYHEEVTSREMPSPRSASTRPFPPSSTRESFLIPSPQRVEYVNDQGQMFTRPRAPLDRHSFSHDPVNSTSERVSRVVLEDVPLQRQLSGHYTEPSPRYVRPALELVNAPSQSQYYVRQQQPGSSPGQYGSSVISHYVPSNREVVANSLPPNDGSHQALRLAQPPTAVHRSTLRCFGPSNGTIGNSL